MQNIFITNSLSRKNIHFKILKNFIQNSLSLIKLLKMKKFILFSIFALFLSSCIALPTNGKTEPTSLKPEKNEEGEWELIVMDVQYNGFLTTEARPISMYTEQYLKTKNTFLVQEWNSYFYSRAYPNVVESTIDYDPNEKYGLEFEYRLYQVFAMCSSRYNVPFTNLGQMDKRRF